MSEECGVCIGGAEPDGPCEVYDHRIIAKSRKEHHCLECGREIPIGSSYHYYFTVFDGEAQSDHICIACEDIAEAFYCDSRILGSLWEDAHESGLLPNLTTACFAKLKTQEGRDYLRERWMKWKGLTI